MKTLAEQTKELKRLIRTSKSTAKLPTFEECIAQIENKTICSYCGNAYYDKAQKKFIKEIGVCSNCDHIMTDDLPF